MEQVFLGEYIRQRRKDLGLSQAELCEGICDAVTLSRLERGRQSPSYLTISALLQRLGLPGNRYFALQNKNERDIDLLQMEITNDEIAFERALKEDRPRIREQALAKLEQLERIADPADNIVRQYILSEKVSLGRPEGPYGFEERLELLTEAIRLTVPRFDPERIDRGWYSLEETAIIAKIARTYSLAGQKRKAIDIYRQLLSYIEKHDQELAGFAGHFCLVAHNYAICLGLEKRYEEAIELAERGQRVCVRYGNYQSLPGFLAILAECYYFTGDSKKSADCYMGAYHIYKATGDHRNMETMRREMRERLGIEPSY